MKNACLALVLMLPLAAVPASFSVNPPGATMEVAFSPNEGATRLVLGAIGEARHSIMVAAYSFTSRPIAQALVSAFRRGVDVKLIVDKSQKRQRNSAARFLADMGIPTRVDSRHAIFHDKYMVIDGSTVENGSFNYTASAEKRNAENVLLIRNNPGLASTYSANWKEHWDHSELYSGRYN